VSGGHGHEVDPGDPLDGPLERLAPEAKVAGAAAFLLAVVATPATAWAAVALDATVAVAVAVIALVPAVVLVRRLLFEIPFLALGAAFVVFGADPRVPVAGLSVSQPGLVAAWTVLERATLGVVTASVLAATTPPADLVVALERLRAPALLRSVTAVALRYLGVLRAELDRLRLAQELRSPDRRRLGPAEVAGIGAALFVRTYERGERVHLARAARSGVGDPGATGTTAAPAPGERTGRTDPPSSGEPTAPRAPTGSARPTAARGPRPTEPAPATARDWALALAPAALAGVAAVLARWPA
jgi:cobalt/nickel transport system permease protein